MLFEQLMPLEAIRENNKVVYYVPDTSSTEVVLYNFNLSIGCKAIKPYGGGNTLTVTHIDFVLTSDGYYKQYGLRIIIPNGPTLPYVTQ